jgi:hypothetical protein
MSVIPTGASLIGVNATLVNNVVGGGIGWQVVALTLKLGASAVLAGNTIDGGTGFDYARPYETMSGTTSVLVNNVVWGAQGATAGAELRGAATLMNNDFWGLEYECLARDWSGGVPDCLATPDEINGCGWSHCQQAGGNLSNDPAFVNQPAGDWHLTAGSPCLDAGVDPAPWCDVDWVNWDFEWQPRPMGLGWDIGADEYEVAASR